MQIVIDIDEEEYRTISINKGVPYHLSPLIGSAILNGTPLPKGHGDLIDVSRKITVSVYDEQYEEWEEKTLTVREALNRWSDEGVTAADVIIPADMAESDEGEE